MKDITPRLIELFKEGYCTPQISRIAKKLQEPSSTVHYNIKKLEKEAIKTYKAVFEYKKIGEGFCAFALINLSADEYADPEKIAGELSNYKEVEGVDICTGDWEIAAKIRCKNQDEYYEIAKSIFSKKGIVRIKTLTSLKQLKTEFVKS